jgi:hypothetical protein
MVRTAKKVITGDCAKHGKTEFIFTNHGRWRRCRKCRSEMVSRARQRIKVKLVEALGGKCQRCGYNRCIAALEFHHRDPATKSFGLGQGCNASLKRCLEEAKKCDLLCANCHREVEEGISLETAS